MSIINILLFSFALVLCGRGLLLWRRAKSTPTSSSVEIVVPVSVFGVLVCTVDALLSVIWKRQGTVYGTRESRTRFLGAATVVVDAARLDAYARVVAGDRTAPAETESKSYYADLYDSVMSCFIESLCLPLMLAVVSNAHFPVSPIALVHVGQSLTQYERVNVADRLQLRLVGVRFRTLDKGVEVDLDFEAHRSSLLVWQGTSTLLSRNSGTIRRSIASRSRASVNKTATGDGGDDDFERARRHLLAPFDATCGWSFASVSYDYNLHHLNRTTARLVGFSSPIAHGMLSLARTLHTLRTPVRHTVDIRWRRPIRLPNDQVEVFLHQTGRGVRLSLPLQWSVVLTSGVDDRVVVELRDFVSRESFLFGAIGLVGKKN